MQGGAAGRGETVVQPIHRKPGVIGLPGITAHTPPANMTPGKGCTQTHRLAGTCRQYSKKAMPQEMAIARMMGHDLNCGQDECRG